MVAQWAFREMVIPSRKAIEERSDAAAEPLHSERSAANRSFAPKAIRAASQTQKMQPAIRADKS